MRPDSRAVRHDDQRQAGRRGIRTGTLRCATLSKFRFRRNEGSKGSCVARSCLTPGTLGYNPKSVKIGYEISFTRYFYKPVPMRTLDEIRADILTLERETDGVLAEILGGSAA